MKIVKATTTHIPELAVLFDKYRVFYRQSIDIANSHAFLSERIEKKQSEIFIAIDETETLLGFTQLYPIFSSTRLKKAWLLNDLFVLPAARGKGISKLLMQEAKELCINTGAHGIMLETEKSNTIGNKLYPSVGFQLCNDSTNYYEWNPS